MEKKTIDEILNEWEGGQQFYGGDLHAAMQEYGEQCRKEGFIQGRDKAIAFVKKRIHDEDVKEWISDLVEYQESTNVIEEYILDIAASSPELQP